MSLQETVFHYVDRMDEWFYLVTFIWTFIEGETFVIFAGYAAKLGIIDLYWLIAAACLGSFAGDQLVFFIGRRYGHRLLARFPKWRGGVETALDFLHRYNTGFILSFRFIYGVRNFSSFAMGMSSLSWIRFLSLNFIAALLWAISFAGAGYLFGHLSEAILGKAARDIGFGILALFVVVVWLLARHHRKRRKAAQAERNPATPRE